MAGDGSASVLRMGRVAYQAAGFLELLRNAAAFSFDRL
jgi:hypothetical protein